MLYILDNYDSFVYNLASYISEAGHSVFVQRTDEMTLNQLQVLNPDGIILSPGPGHPKNSIQSNIVLDYFQDKVPILGVCLGHQVISHFFGAKIIKGNIPMHGKISRITHYDSPLFSDLPDSFNVTRYHSLQVSEDAFPNVLQISARSEDNVIMGIQHKILPIYGVQFHPEALLSEYGHELLNNFCKICERWKKTHYA
jgi:anthranilate synthase component 2/para-aminobenzoate synthetase component 2